MPELSQVVFCYGGCKLVLRLLLVKQNEDPDNVMDFGSYEFGQNQTPVCQALSGITSSLPLKEIKKAPTGGSRKAGRAGKAHTCG